MIKGEPMLAGVRRRKVSPKGFERAMQILEAFRGRESIKRAELCRVADLDTNALEITMTVLENYGAVICEDKNEFGLLNFESIDEIKGKLLENLAS